MRDGLRRWVCFLSAALAGCAAGGPDLDRRGQAGVPADASGDGGLSLGPGAPKNCDGGSTITIKSLTPGRHTLGASGDGCTQVIDWGEPLDAGTPEVPKPPSHETYECPPNQLRVHIRDLWSSLASPSLNQFADRPISVVVVAALSGQLDTVPRILSVGWLFVLAAIAEIGRAHV